MAKKYALIFPGQGSQYVGMGLAMSQAYPEAANIFQQANDILGYPVTQLCFNGPEEELTETGNLQPALFTTSMAACAVLEKRLFPICEPDAASGHSLGEFSALVVARSLTFEDALRLVCARGRAMRKAGEIAPGGMLALLGVKSTEIVDEVCAEVEEKTGLIVRSANENCPGQIVVAGNNGALDELERVCEERGITTMIRRLKITIPGHSILLEPALPDFLDTLASIRIEKPTIPVISILTAQPLLTEKDIREELEKQLTHRVKWIDTTLRIVKDGINAVVEVGPGKVLTGLTRRIEPSLGRHNFGDEPEALDSIISSLTAG